MAKADVQICKEALPNLMRRKAFVDAAREAFFDRGYAGTTMSSIAAAVGGSKTTLWAYFPSKEALFAAVVDDIIERHGKPLTMDLPLEEDPAAVLAQFADVLAKTLTSWPMIDLHRLVIGEAKRFPHLAKLFYERGPARGKARLALYFRQLMEKGALRKGDPMQAARQFVALCQSGGYQLAIFGLARHRARSAAQETRMAVDVFMTFWGEKAGAKPKP